MSPHIHKLKIAEQRQLGTLVNKVKGENLMTPSKPEEDCQCNSLKKV